GIAADPAQPPTGRHGGPHVRQAKTPARTPVPAPARPRPDDPEPGDRRRAGHGRPGAVRPRPAQDLRQPRRSPQGRVARRGRGRLLRPARAQRRRQEHPDRHRQFAGQPDLGLGRDLRYRHPPRPRRCDAPDGAGAAGDQLQHLRAAARHPGQLRGVLRDPPRGGVAACRGGTPARAVVGQGPDDEPDAVGRHEAPADDRPRNDDAAAPADPRRAHRRCRHRNPPRHVADPARDQRRRHHHHPHHPLPRGSRVPVPQPGDHRPRHDRRRRADEDPAGPARRRGLRARHRRCAAGGAAGDRRHHRAGARRPHARHRDAARDGPQPRVRRAWRCRHPGAVHAYQEQPARGAVRAHGRRRRTGHGDVAGGASMSHPNLVALGTVARREISRILRIWAQTLVPPAITMTLYFLIFGGLIGSRIGTMDGIAYMDFIVPGLVMMSIIQNSYGNIASSFFGAKFGRHVEELLVSPMPNWVILGGYVAGAVARGLAVGAIVLLIASLFTDVRVPHPLVTLATVLLGATIFALAGFVNAVYARKFDDIAIVPTFILTPLTYLGGVFYSVKLLPGWAEAMTHANPIFYMVNAFRYGLLG